MSGMVQGARDSKLYSVVSALERYVIQKEKETHKYVIVILCEK